VMPRLEVRADANGAIADVAISYPQDLTRQMLEYSEQTRGLRRQPGKAGEPGKPAKPGKQ